MKVKELYYYPVKSCRPVKCNSVELSKSGLKGDREFVIVDGEGNFLTQRKYPNMALLDAVPKGDQIHFQYEGKEQSFSLKNFEEKEATVWDHTSISWDQGPEISEFLSDVFGFKCSLMRTHANHGRFIKEKYGLEEKVPLSYVDSMPILVLSHSALAELNSKLEKKADVLRFRPNIVLDDCDPHAEDTWGKFKIGNIEFVKTKPCARCTVINVDQTTGEVFNETLRAVAGYRRSKERGGVEFGAYYFNESLGSISVGEEAVITVD